jgi:hypothetical protein
MNSDTREMQSKTTLSYYNTPIKLDKIKNANWIPSEDWNCNLIRGGVCKMTVTWKTVWRCLRKLNTYLSHGPAKVSDLYLKQNVHKKTYTRIFPEVLCLLIQDSIQMFIPGEWKQIGNSSEYYSPIKRNQQKRHKDEFQFIMLSKRSQTHTKKDTIWFYLYKVLEQAREIYSDRNQPDQRFHEAEMTLKGDQKGAL